MNHSTKPSLIHVSCEGDLHKNQLKPDFQSFQLFKAMYTRLFNNHLVILFFLFAGGLISFPLISGNLVNKGKNIENIRNLQVIATVSGQLTCATEVVQLNASASDSTASFFWSGPLGFSSTWHSPNISQPGIYTVMAMSGADTVSDTVEVLQDIQAPTGVFPLKFGNLSCFVPSVEIHGKSLTSGASYSWSGPNNFSSTEKNIVVSQTGIYTITVTNPVNGCKTSASTEVFYDENISFAEATIYDPITCLRPCRKLFRIPNAPSAIYAIRGPGGYYSNNIDADVCIPGTYYVTATDFLKECSSTYSQTILGNLTPPIVSVNISGNLSCSTPSVTITATSPTPGATFYWTGPNGFTSSSPSIAVAIPGLYTLTVTNPINGCKSTAPTNVNIDTTMPFCNISLRCEGNSIVLFTPSTIPGVTYSWSGPGGFTSFLPSPKVTLPGRYIVTITNPVNGCSTTCTIDVPQSVLPGATATASGILTCINPSVTLSGSSPAPGVSYLWNGPEGFTSSLQNPTVSTPGTYILTVQNMNFDCKSFDTVVVIQDASIPGFVASASGVLTCTNRIVTLSVSSSISDVSYLWTGPGGFSSTLQNVNVSMPGTYMAKVTSLANGCFSTQIVTVLENLVIPQGVTVTKSGDLSCNTTSVTLSGASTTPGVTYFWTGPGGFVSSNPVTSVSYPGVYTLTVTNQVNGCSVATSIQVSNNLTSPDLIIIVGGKLTCTNTNVTISVSYRPELTYRWSGPNGFIAYGPSVVVSLPGLYSLTVSSPLGGCSASATAIVLQDIAAPNSTAIPSGALDCLNPVVTLLGNSTSPGVVYNWTGPNQFSSNSQNPVVSFPGLFILKVTNPLNGCWSTSSVNVIQNGIKPDAIASVSGVLSCLNTSVVVSGSSSTPEVTYEWQGPGGFNSNLQSPTVSIPGTYLLTVRSLITGCYNTVAVDVLQNIVSPKGAISVSGKITCANPTVTLTGTSSTPGATYFWTGPEGFVSSKPVISVSKTGNYTLMVTDPVNGCVFVGSINVLGNTTPPNIMLSKNRDLSCANDVVTLNGSSSTPGVSYMWMGPGGFFSTAPSVNVAWEGVYVLVVANMSTGCTASKSITVYRNYTQVTAWAFVTGPITCTNPSVTLVGYSGTPNAGFLWTGPMGFSSNLYNPVVSQPGLYILTVTDPISHCQSVASVSVESVQNILSVYLFSSGIISCNTPEVELLGISEGENVNYSWDGPEGFAAYTSNATTTLPGIYTLTVTDAISGCQNVAQIEVLQSPCNTPASSALRVGFEKTDLEVIAYPNPAKSNITLRFVATEDDHYSLNVYSLDGRSFKLFDEKVYGGKSYHVVFDGDVSAHGLYVYKLSTKKGMKQGKFILTK